ncbi:VCBS repeat-containing protein [Streptomyces gilvus]|uniref:VCBS repeat-containing protein n=1 Tax=Streptomyces gilvus TaxID=2920937 RepID=UPI001F0F754C|nr:VCBS repeat-containing protein [Streptomyces sp. CME 23]MCH5676737.1 VCBS repeat-containing protein [Streptomyces sp. CME 23]
MPETSRRQRPTRRFTRCALVVALVGGALGLLPPAAGAAGTADPERDALRLAAETGEPVEVLSERTETSETHALPNGNLRQTQHTLPVRVKREGVWTPVDTTLAETAGRVSPKAAPGRVTFSAGGDDRLVTLTDQGGELTLTWPASLPVPVLDGPTATYREVFPGVDLAVKASLDGFSQALIVKTPEAAERPELKEIGFGLRTQGLQVREDAGTGTLSAVNAAGQTVFASATARMWDSSGTTEQAAAQTVRRTASLSAATPESDPSPLTPGTKSSPVDVEVTDGHVVLTPDQDLLQAADTEFPVYIDPRMTGTREAWTIAYKPHPKDSYWNGTGWDGGTTSEARVGYESSTGGTARSFFRVGSKFLAGVKVVDAQFQITETHSWSCTPKPVELWRTGTISSTTTWSAQPSWAARQDTRSVAHGNESFGCPNAAVDFDANEAAGKAAAGKWSNITFGLRAPQSAEDNKDEYSWKKFKPDAKLIVEFNRPPKAPWALDTVPSTRVGTTECGNGSSYVTLGNTDVTLTAQVWDPDGGAVNVQFHLWATGKHDTSPGIIFDKRVKVTVKASDSKGAQARVVVGKDLLTRHLGASNGQFSWKAQAEDTADAAFASDWTPTQGAPGCRFGFDPNAPTVMPTVGSQNDLYPETKPDSEPVEGALARTEGVFEFGANGVSDTTEYLYGLDRTPPSSSAKPATKGGPAQARITPLTPGPHTLYVRLVDAGGNAGPVYPYRFYVRSPGVTDGPGDVNGDGIPDLFAVDGSANLRLYGGTGAGKLATMVPLSTGGGWNDALLTHRGDWTEDFYEDLVARRADGRLWLYPNNGQGEFTEDTKQEVYVFPDEETGTALNPATIRQIVSVGDITPDGEAQRPDFVAVVGDQLWFLPGYAYGTVESGYLIGASGWGRMQLASPGDVDGDGFTDLVARNTENGELWLYHGRSPGDADGDGVSDGGTDPASLGAVSNRTAYATGWTTTARPLVTASGDSDGDGVPDLWTTTANSSAGLEFVPGRRSGFVGPVAMVGTTGWQAIRVLS